MEIDKKIIIKIWADLKNGICNLPDGLSEAKISLYSALSELEKILEI
jgi:hypothetical protein